MKTVKKYPDLKKRLYLICALAFAALYALVALAIEPLYVSVSSDVASSVVLTEVLYYSCLALERLAIWFCYAVLIFCINKFGSRSSRSLTLIFLLASFFKYLTKTAVNWVYLGAIPSSLYIYLVDVLYFVVIEMIEFFIVRALASRMIEKSGDGATTLDFTRVYSKENRLLRASLAASVVVLSFDLLSRIANDAIAIIAYGPPEQTKTLILMALYYLLTLLSGLLCYIVLSYALYALCSRYGESDAESDAAPRKELCEE